jgi:hypothetical protein
MACPPDMRYRETTSFCLVYSSFVLTWCLRHCCKQDGEGLLGSNLISDLLMFNVHQGNGAMQARGGDGDVEGRILHAYGCE